MNTTQASSWMDEKQAELMDMEWDRRLLDEQTRRRQPDDDAGFTAEAMREKEAEAGRLRAELAVASFVEEFYTLRETARGRALIASADVGAWRHPPLTRDHLARFVLAETESLTRSDATMRWDPPTSHAGATAGQWWVDLDARCIRAGRDTGRRRYRFHVVNDQVDAWIALDDHPQRPST